MKTLIGLGNRQNLCKPFFINAGTCMLVYNIHIECIVYYLSGNEFSLLQQGRELYCSWKIVCGGIYPWWLCWAYCKFMSILNCFNPDQHIVQMCMFVYNENIASLVNMNFWKISNFVWLLFNTIQKVNAMQNCS